MKKLVLSMMSVAILAGAGWGCAHKAETKSVEQPVQTPFGWHLLQVLERRDQDVSKDRTRDQARLALRQRKSDEQFQEFVRQTRDRAYVEVKADER